MIVRVYVTDCTVWSGSGRSAQVANNIWCAVDYGKCSGWANAYFLAADDGQRLACLIDPAAQGCENARR
jgi:hypothetical protein